MITADKDAELAFQRFIRTVDHKRFKDISFLGEETLDDVEEPLNLARKEGTFVLVDALDGSDLYERNLGNWCAAATFFTPTNEPGKRIRAAIAGVPNGAIYFATDSSQGVRVIRKPRSPTCDVKGMSRVEDLEKASICFYGQKVEGFLKSAESPMWRLLRESDRAYKERKSDGIGLRMYNLGGIPMILRMIDKVTTIGHGIDAVIEFKGQRAHDIVPGAFFAIKAGAKFTDLRGNPIAISRLERLLFKPNLERLTYIMAVSKKLNTKIARSIRTDHNRQKTALFG